MMTATATEKTEKVNWRIPKELLRRLNATATQRQQPVESLVSEVLSGFLQPLAASEDDPFDREVARLSGQSLTQLRETAQTRMAVPDRERLACLTELSKERLLTTEEALELEGLLYRLEAAIGTRMAAIYLLRTRHHVSDIS